MKRVRKIANPSMTGELTGRERHAGGLRLVEVRWDTGSLSNVPDSQIESIEVSLDNLDDHVHDPRFGRFDDLRRLLTFQKLQGTLHDFIYSMEAARIDFLEYQFKPVLKFIDSPTERLLIADEVGLGKTIEAALIWLEMQARRNARRLLVVCPGMLASKWKRELREKFGVIAEIRDPRSALEEAKQVQRGGRHTPACWIAPYTAFRPWREDWAALNDPEQKTEQSPRFRFLQELRDFSIDEPFFDLVIFDEAHLMRNSETANARLGRILGDCSRSVLCVSATPVNNKSEDLYSLLRLLDEDFFSSSALFEQLLDENRAAISAMNCLMRHPVDAVQLQASLKSLKTSRLVGSLPALDRAIEESAHLALSDHDQIIRLQALVEDLNVLGGYISRTRRRQVKERRAIRRVKVLPVKFSEAERRFYWGVTTGVRLRVAQEGKQFSVFHLITPQLRMASCIPAMLDSYRSGRLQDLDLLIEAGFESESPSQETEDSLAKQVNQLYDDLRDYDFEANDSKYCALRDYILQELGKEKAVLFSFFKGTLNYLRKRLQQDGILSAVIHGDVEQFERDEILARFESDQTIQILLSSEVGSEGIDLQFCHVLVNYDLPWNPMRIEQRIGRIDRVGQKSETLTIVHLKITDTIEERLYDRLHDKLRVFENSIGDLEAVLGEETEKLGRDLLSSELSPLEEEQMIAQTELAVRTRLEQMRQLEESSSTLVAHGDFISARVGRQRDLGRFISARDIEFYVKDFFLRNFRGCRETWGQPQTGCFSVDLTMDAMRSLRDFIDQGKYPSHPGIQERKIWGCFDIDVAKVKYRGQPIPLHNHLSPVVRWITHQNQQHPDSSHPLAAFAWQTDQLEPGHYAYRIERWTMVGLRTQEHLSFGLTSFGAAKVFSAIESERFIGQALQGAERWDFPDIQAQPWQGAQLRLKSKLSEWFDQACRDFDARNQSLLQIKIGQVNRHFERRRSSDTKRLETMQASGRRDTMLRLVESNMQKDSNLRRHRIEEMESRATFTPEVSELGAGVIKVETM
jgi:SNF2 family DNA or RNA helicase